MVECEVVGQFKKKKKNEVNVNNSLTSAKFFVY